MDPGFVWIGRAVWWVGLALHLVVGWLYWVTPLLAPAWILVVLLPAWAGFLWLQIRWRRRRPWLSFLIPGAALGVWWAVVSLGGLFLGWTA